VIELKNADKHDVVQWYTLYHQQDDTVTASSSITSAASLEVGYFNIIADAVAAITTGA